MALEPRADLAEILQWRPYPIGDPVPWWLFNEVDKATLVELAQISLARQVEELAVQTKALNAAIEVIGRAR
jgi:hypothetical protein